MKKVSLSVVLNAPDNFEVGKCENCPIAKKEYQEPYYNIGTYMVSCPIGCKPMSCPMEAKECLKSS